MLELINVGFTCFSSEFLKSSFNFFKKQWFFRACYVPSLFKDNHVVHCLAKKIGTIFDVKDYSIIFFYYNFMNFQCFDSFSLDTLSFFNKLRKKLLHYHFVVVCNVKLHFICKIFAGQTPFQRTLAAHNFFKTFLLLSFDCSRIKSKSFKHLHLGKNWIFNKIGWAIFHWIILSSFIWLPFSVLTIDFTGIRSNLTREKFSDFYFLLIQHNFCLRVKVTKN